MDALAGQVALLDDLSDGEDLIARDRLPFVGVGKRFLYVGFFGAGDLDRDAGRQDAALDSGDEALFTMLEEVADRIDMGGTEIGLLSDLAGPVAALLEGVDLAHEFEG